jgi:hypothetical protein
MALPVLGSTIESMVGGLPGVRTFGLNTLQASNLAGFLVDTSGNVTIPGTLAVTGVTTFTGAASGPTLRPITDSAAVGATVVLTAADSGKVFNNASTSGSPSWTLPTAANGLWFTFTCGNTTAGFTVTGGTIKAKASATGAAITGTTLTHTQGTAVIGDCITLVCDGTVWRSVAQDGTFAAA